MSPSESLQSERYSKEKLAYSALKLKDQIHPLVMEAEKHRNLVDHGNFNLYEVELIDGRVWGYEACAIIMSQAITQLQKTKKISPDARRYAQESLEYCLERARRQRALKNKGKPMILVSDET